MDGLGGRKRWRDLKRRLRFKGMSCCGASWGFPASDMNVAADNDVEQEIFIGAGGISPRGAGGAAPPESPVSLAAALAAERSTRAAVAWRERAACHSGVGRGTTLMRLMEESDGQDEGSKARRGRDGVCCVCMERDKGAAFIPCGHTFCRICCRDLRSNRRSCPICNRLILEVLDIF